MFRSWWPVSSILRVSGRFWASARAPKTGRSGYPTENKVQAINYEVWEAWQSTPVVVSVSQRYPGRQANQFPQPILAERRSEHHAYEGWRRAIVTVLKTFLEALGWSAYGRLVVERPRYTLDELWARWVRL
jgi:hypothetical protein